MKVISLLYFSAICMDLAVKPVFKVEIDSKMIYRDGDFDSYSICFTLYTALL